MKSQVDVEFEYVVRAEPQPGARPSVVTVGKGHNGVQTVISAGHLQYHKDRAVAAGCDLSSFFGGFSLQGRKCMRQECRHRPGRGGTERGAAKKFAPRLQ